MSRITETSTDDWRVKGAKFIRYLTSRKTETWVFFVAGAVLGKIFL